MKEKVHKETFFFNVINETNQQYSDKDISTDKKNPPIQKEVIINNTYTIQVASHKSIEKAKNDMNELIEKGFDAYIEDYFDNKNNVQRWRVRIGSFKNKQLAMEVKKKLSKFRGEDPWIAYIK